MQFDDIFVLTGAYGPYQAFMTVLCGSLCLWSVEVISQIFIDAKMDHWCAVPELRKFSKVKAKYIAIPKTDESTFDHCLMFDYDYANFTAKQLTDWNRKSMYTSRTRPCNDGWTYDSPQFESTTVSRFNLVCDNALLIPTLSSCFMAGILVGALLSGPVADLMGRKAMILIFLIIKVVGCLISMLASNFTVYAGSRLILGIGNSGVYMGAFVLLIEVVGPEYRSNVGVFNGLAFGIGTMITAGLAYFFRTDFHMHIVMMVPTVCMLTYYMLLDDSARWQLVTKRYEAADRGIKKMAKWNGTVIPSDFDVMTIEFQTQTKSTGTVIDLFRTAKLRQRTLIIYIIWFVVSLMYYGLTLNTGQMSGNIYLNTFLSGAVEIPANFLCVVLLNWDKTGRRYTTAGSGVLAGVSSFLCVPFIMSGKGWQATMLAMIGKAFVTICYNAIYVFSAEIFPTELRNGAMGVSSCCARLSSMAAPFFGEPLTRMSKSLPYIIFGALSTMAGFLALFLPETLNAKLCDTVEEAETFNGWNRQRPSAVGPATDSDSFLPPIVGDRGVAGLKSLEPSSPPSEEIPQSTHTINVVPATDDEGNNISI